VKVGIVGSRNYGNLSEVRHYARLLVSRGDVIVSGGAFGVDAEAQRASEQMGVGAIVFAPDYEKHGRGAPLKRNEQIVAASDKVVAFWDGKSTGTLDTIRKAVKAGKTVVINPRVSPKESS
jgi:predicted Rossmann fold nucleotide-binding protein DprA/Smf involved in DNA uptake